MKISTQNNTLTIQCSTWQQTNDLIERLSCIGISVVQKKRNVLAKLLDFIVISNSSTFKNNNIYLSITDSNTLQQALNLKDKSEYEIIKSIEYFANEEISEFGLSLENKILKSIIPKQLEQYQNFWDNDDQTQDKFNAVAQLLSDYVVNTPYHAKNFSGNEYKFVHNDYTVWRPNHDTSHAIRQYFFAKKLNELVSIEGTREFKIAANGFTNEEKACVELAAYLFRSGRTNELSWQDDESNQTRSRDIFIGSARKLGFKEELIQHIGYLIINWCKLTRENDNTLTSDIDDHIKDNHGNEYDGFTGTSEEKNTKTKLTKRLLDIAHHSDLQRCWNIDGSKDYSLIHDNLRLELEFLLGSKDKAAEYTIRLMYFVADCTEQTGNKIQGGGNVYIGFNFPDEDNYRRKVEVNKDVGACINALHANNSILTAKDVIASSKAAYKRYELLTPDNKIETENNSPGTSIQTPKHIISQKVFEDSSISLLIRKILFVIFFPILLPLILINKLYQIIVRPKPKDSCAYKHQKKIIMESYPVDNIENNKPFEMPDLFESDNEPQAHNSVLTPIRALSTFTKVNDEQAEQTKQNHVNRR